MRFGNGFGSRSQIDDLLRGYCPVMKIAFLSFCFPEYCIRHANELAREHQVLLLLPENRLDGVEAMLDPRVQFVGFHGARYRQPLRQCLTNIKILRAIGKFRPDVIHYQNGYLYFNPLLPLLRTYPLVITIHDPRQHLGDRESLITPQWLMDFGFRRADQVIVHGQELIETVHREVGIPQHLIHSIPHIAIGDQGDMPLSMESGLKVLFFGRIWEYKGLEYLIKAEPVVSREFPDVKFVIGGKGEDFERYRKMMVHPDQFEIHNGWISDEDRARLFSECSIVVLPYIEASQSGVIPLAYGHGKPVIATTVGGLPGMVEHGITGLLVPPRNHEALAKEIMHLLRDVELRNQMGRAAREKLNRECAPEVVVQQTLEIYRAAIAQDSGRAKPLDSGRNSTANQPREEHGSGIRDHQKEVSA